MNKVQLCARLLSNENECLKAMIKAVNNYPISAKQHLTKPIGKRPWIGQAACNIELGATEEETRIAWNFYMSKQSQDLANSIADTVIDQWISENA